MMTDSLRLVQLMHPQRGRKLAIVEEPQLVLLDGATSVYALALEAIASKQQLTSLALSKKSAERIAYDPVYENRDPWKLLPSFDHPSNTAACLVSGTGLTHKSSALNRQMMHQSADVKPTDSMQMYQWGVEGGRPVDGKIGVQPEWFYKGTGDILKAHNEPLDIPCFGHDGGEEPEIAGVYVIDGEGKPWRIGFTTGNEFSDHVMEKKNYLYLAPSKLRNCAVGPELVLRDELQEVTGTVGIWRDNQVIWTSEIHSGEKNMAHSVANLEHHHFKYPGHRLPLQAHLHFFGADAFSFGNQIKLENGDEMRISWQGMGRPLQNSLRMTNDEEKLQVVQSLS